MSDWPASIIQPPKTVITTFSANCMGPNRGSVSAFSSAVWPANNRAIYLPFTIDLPYLVQRVGWMNGTTLGGSIDVGVFEKDGRHLGSLGSTAQVGTNSSQVGDMADITIDPGAYYMGISCSLNTATMVATTLLGALALRAAGLQVQNLAGVALATNANPAVFANPASAYLPYVSLFGVPIA